MLVEFTGNQMNFQTISRGGQTIDSGAIVPTAQSASATPAASSEAGNIR